MVKPPAWLKMSAPYDVDGKAMIDVEIKVRHPAFIRFMWGAYRQEIRRQGYNPNSPVMLAFVVLHLAKIFMKGGDDGEAAG